MLHNVLIEAGKTVRIAKQGRFINLVLASGEINARIEYENGSVFETKVVSGMAFQAEREFIAVSFSAETTQQSKVWLSNLPLTYSPNESVVVGSRALTSSSAELYFNDITQLLPARNGRGKITFQADKEYYLAGAGATLNNAIKVPAGELFTFATQGAVYGYSGDIDDIAKRYIEMTDVSTTAGRSALSGKHGAIVYNPINDELIFSGATAASLLRMSASDLTQTAINITTPFSKVNHTNIYPLDNESFVVYGYIITALHRVVFKYSDYSVVSNTLLATSNHGSAYSLTISGNRFAWIGGGTGTPCYTGTLDGANTVLVDKSLYPFADWRVVTINSIGELFFTDNSGGSWAATTDNGATWDSGVFGATLSIVSLKWSYDSVSGYIYALSSTHTPYVSKNNGRTFVAVPYTPNTGEYSPTITNSLHVYGGDIYVSGGTSLHFYKVSEGRWLDLPIGDVSYFTSVCRNGLIYISGSANAIIEVVGGIEKSIGGMSINILEETS